MGEVRKGSGEGGRDWWREGVLRAGSCEDEVGT
jgi:hypothetical protein